MAELIYHPEAKIEVKEAAEYYENCQPGLGQAYLAAVESAVDRITLHPTAWRIIRGSFRRTLVSKFPYSIIYSFDGNEALLQNLCVAGQPTTCQCTWGSAPNPAGATPDPGG